MTFHEWARRHNARVVKREDVHKYPTERVAFETRNFGWVLSEQDETGHRRIVARE